MTPTNTPSMGSEDEAIPCLLCGGRGAVADWVRTRNEMHRSRMHNLVAGLGSFIPSPPLTPRTKPMFETVKMEI